MSNKPAAEQNSTKEMLGKLWRRLRRFLSRNWGMKLMCLGLSIVLWGGLISQDPNLTREKTFKDVAVNAVSADVLQRNGLIVVEGIENIPAVQLRAAVPQQNYDSASASSYNVRVDLSRITQPGLQMLPILTSSSTPYGQVTYLSATEVEVSVDEYVTRRRIPVQLNKQSQAPAGFYAPAPTVDPALVAVSGPRSLVDQVARCVAIFDLSRLAPQTGIQLTAIPFQLQSMDGEPINMRNITVTSESILLDTVMIEQTLHPMKTVDINASGLVQGQPAAGYEVASVSISPAYLSVAGTSEFLNSLHSLDLEGSIDVNGAAEDLVRAVKVIRPAQALFMSEEAVYITVEITPLSQPSDAAFPGDEETP